MKHLGKRGIWAVLALSGLLMVAGMAQAALIDIDNPGFETVSAAWIQTVYAGKYTTSVDGWSNSGSVGTFQPTALNYNELLPEPQNVAWLGNGALQQTLAATLQAGDYELTYYLGDRKYLALSNYTVALVAGSTTLASSSQLNPGDGKFALGNLTYTADAANALIGQPLAIKITSSGSGQATFDYVQLDFTPATPMIIPIPPSFGLLASGLVGVLALARRRQ